MASSAWRHSTPAQCHIACCVTHVRLQDFDPEMGVGVCLVQATFMLNTVPAVKTGSCATGIVHSLV